MKISKSGFDAVQQEQESRIARGGLGSRPSLLLPPCQIPVIRQGTWSPKPNRTMAADAIRIERPTTNSKLFAHTRWDAVPAAAGLIDLQARPRRRGRKSMELRFSEFLPR